MQASFVLVGAPLVTAPHSSVQDLNDPIADAFEKATSGEAKGSYGPSATVYS